MDKKTNYTTYVFDLDGTLLNSKKQVSSANASMLNLLQNKKKQIIIATGRPYYMNLGLFNDLNIKGPMISANGSIIYDLSTKQLVYQSTIDKPTAKLITQYLEDNQIDYLGYTTYFMVGKNFNNPSWFNQRIYPFMKEDNKYKWDYREIEIAKNSDDLDFVKLLVLCEKNESKIADLKQFLAQFNSIYTVASQQEVLDIMPKGTNKGNTLIKLAQIYNINLNDAVAFGDADNDIEMLKAVGYPIAMGNAEESLKQVAKDITLTNDQDGVAIKIKELEDEII
ncbi:HAD family hydrolase [Mycoplasma sp. NEAQ87857]|uniref:HAD family hydrolase n=1 Tax=Mycoplasma sp. NEAQ87857 TaxID=2683967 RepID=UPI00131D68EA|nr:HAD family hydrolase [Mycoplasma sp. NEAQ87857]